MKKGAYLTSCQVVVSCHTVPLSGILQGTIFRGSCMQEKFHQYDLTTELAKKHSHATYLASPTDEPEHQVVLTVFSASLFHFPHERENLLQKAQRIKQLQHPHLLPILDMGIEEEQPFVMREYLPKGSLRSHLKQ